MKILLVSSGSGSRGGGEIFLDYLGRGLSDRGHDVIVWIPNHARMDELAAKCAPYSRVVRASYRNTYDYRLRSIGAMLNWRVPRRLAADWEALSPDVIHINKQNLEDGLDLLRALRNICIPSICTIHLTQTATNLRARMPKLRDRIARQQLGSYGGTIVAVQERRREILADFLGGRARTASVFNGVPSADLVDMNRTRESIRCGLGLSPHDFLVIGAGRLVDQKKPFRFLEIAKQLHARVPRMRFLWVGDGVLAPKWNSQVVQEGLQNVVSCTGWQSNVQPYLLAGDALLHVAEYEGLPFAIIEAMAANLPCAVTRDIASEVPLFNEENVVFVEGIDELARKLCDAAGLAQISRNARHLFEAEFSLDGMVRSYEKLYVDAISRWAAPNSEPVR